MIGGYKVNATSYNQYQNDMQMYRQTDQWKAKNNFRIYVVVLTIVLLVLFG